MIYFDALGGVAPTQLTNSNDLDNVVTPGLYQIKDGVAPSNVPQWAGLNDLIEVKAWYNGTMIVQTVYEANNSGNASGYRVRFKDGAWKPWHRVYNDSLLTDSSLLGPLASALGGAMGIVKMEQANATTPFNIGKASGLIVVMSEATRSSAIYAVDPNSNPTPVKENTTNFEVTRSGYDIIVSVVGTQTQSYKLTVYLVGRIQL